MQAVHLASGMQAIKATMDRCSVAHWCIILAYVVLCVLCSICALSGFFEGSSFFHWGAPVEVFNVEITEDKYSNLVWIIVFVNSAMSQFMHHLVNPYIHRRVLGIEQKPVHRHVRFLVLVGAYDLWKILRTLILLLGITSQLGLLIASGIGSVLASQICMLLYLKKPHWFRK